MNARYLLPASIPQQAFEGFLKSISGRMVSSADFLESIKQLCTPVSDEPSDDAIAAMIDAFTKCTHPMHPSMAEAYKAAKLFMPSAKHQGAVELLKVLGYTHDGMGWSKGAEPVACSPYTDADIEQMMQTAFVVVTGCRLRGDDVHRQEIWRQAMRKAVDAVKMQKGNHQAFAPLEWRISTRVPTTVPICTTEAEARDRAIAAAAQHGSAQVIAVVACYERRSEVVEVAA